MIKQQEKESFLVFRQPIVLRLETNTSCIFLKETPEVIPSTIVERKITNFPICQNDTHTYVYLLN